MNIKQHFPVTMRVPLFYVLFTDRHNIQKCTGAKFLKKVLRKKNISYTDVLWGFVNGTAVIDGVRFTFETSKNMTEVWPWEKVIIDITSFDL